MDLDLTKFKTKIFESNIKVDLKGNSFLDFDKLKKEINSITAFVEKFYPHRSNRPLWYKINIADQAVNHYVAIGLLNLESDWLKFVLDYLNNDRAIESGDTIIAIFDIDFSWIVCFTLSQDDKILKVEKFEK